MGLTMTFVLTRQDGDWHGVKDRDLEDMSTIAGHPMLAAHVEDSDWCVVLGRDAVGQEWSWVYGEEGALGFDQAHRWLPSLDADDLDESRPRRAAKVASDVAGWAERCDLGMLRPDALTEVLLDDDVFAEVGWWRLLDLVGLDKVPLREIREAPRHPPVVRGPRSPRPPRAAAIDHTHPGWRRLDDLELLGRFGEPPCVIEWKHILYLASDPPLYLWGGVSDGRLADRTGATGNWITVPQSAASSLADAAAWARANVGVEGAPALPDRPPLLFEVIDYERDAKRPRYRRAQEWQLHEIAPPVSATLIVAWNEGGPEAVAEALAEAHDHVIGEVVHEFTVHDRDVQFDPDGNGTPWSLQVAGALVSTKGRFTMTSVHPSAWPRVVAKARRGGVAEVQGSSIRTTGLGMSRPRHAVAGAGFRLRLVDDPDDLVEHDGDDVSPDMSLPPAPWLQVDADAEFGELLPVSSFLALLEHLAERLPVTRAWLHVGRFPAGRSPWLLVQPVDEPWDEKTYPVDEVRGRLRWLRTATEPPEFKPTNQRSAPRD